MPAARNSHAVCNPGEGGGRRRKGDEEFERQLEMAMMATEASGTLQSGRLASDAAAEDSTSAEGKRGARWQVHYRHATTLLSRRGIARPRCPSQ